MSYWLKIETAKGNVGVVRAGAGRSESETYLAAVLQDLERANDASAQWLSIGAKVFRAASVFRVTLVDDDEAMRTLVDNQLRDNGDDV